MNRLFEFVILTFMVLASLLGLIIFIPGQDILIYGYVAATLVAISVCAVSFSRREIQSLNRQLRERMNSHDRAKGEVARLRAELEKATTKDELTGLHNLDHFKVLLNHERALSERAQYKFTLAMLEIDQYFDIIRNFGNAQANEFLGLSSRVMVAALREVDHVARVGDGRFVMTLCNASEEDSIMVMRRVSKLVAQIKIEEDGGEDFVVTTSAGLTSYHGTESTDLLMEHARKALEYAIKNGRDCVAGFQFDKGEPARV